MQRIRLKEQQSEGKWIPGRLSKEIAALEEKRNAVLAAIETAPTPGARIVLEARYINGWGIQETCIRTHYGRTSIHRLTQHALRTMKFPAGVT